MQKSALTLLQTTLDDAHLGLFALRLTGWLTDDLSQSEETGPEFTESRAKALLRAAEAVDVPTLHSFSRLVSQESVAYLTSWRVGLYDLLEQSDLAGNQEVTALASVVAAIEPAESPPDISWLALAVAAFAWKSEYPLFQLEPDSPPDVYSPAGQLLKRAAHFVRQQVQRSATERDKLARRLAYTPGSSGTPTPTLEDMQPQDPVAPLPPHYRPPIPVSYPEVAQETLHIDEDKEEEAPVVPTRTNSITIRGEDLSQDPPPERMPPIRITADQVQPSAPRSRVVTPGASPPPLASFTKAVRQKFGRSREAFTTTKLIVVVQEYPDGPGLYGLQVRIACKGVRSFVAGTTSRDGKFVSELPVRVRSGLTYDIDITWPQDLGGDVERKSVTLNADRTQFTLPFYRRLRKA